MLRPIALRFVCGIGPAFGVIAISGAQPSPQGPATAAPAPGVNPVEKPAATMPTPDEDERTELVVHLKDGRRFTGPVVRESASEVVIKIAGIAQAFPTSEVDRLEVLEPVMERYRKLHEAVGNDPEQIANLAEWLRQRGKYELALTEITHALAIDKTHAPSLKLKYLLEQQIILKHKSVKRAPEAPDAGAPVRAAPLKAREFPLLSADDVRLIKIFETNLDEKPRVLIDRATVTKMLEKYSDHPLVPITREGREAMLRQSPLETLDLMFKLQARDFYPQVDVLDQPKAFVMLRDQISRTWLINSCSTTLCHGGTEAGRLALYNHSPNSERTVYTNFYILSKYHLAGGAPLINWDEPEKSPLLQMGLPRGKSRRPHPEVPHRVSGYDMFKPTFQTTDDPQFKQAVEWIRSLYRPRPEYPISYTPLRPFDPPAAAPPPEIGGAPKPDAKPGVVAPPKGNATDSPSAPPVEPKPEPKPR